MEQPHTDNRGLRIGIAVAIGLLVLAFTLPNTGGIIEGPPRHGMSRFGPFLFHPSAFFTLVGGVIVATGCTVLGIVRRNACEAVGWVLLAVLVVCMVIQ